MEHKTAYGRVFTTWWDTIQFPASFLVMAGTQAGASTYILTLYSDNKISIHWILYPSKNFHQFSINPSDSIALVYDVLPRHLKPSSLYPVWHVQRYEPSVFKQPWLQGEGFKAHSSTSTKFEQNVKI